MDTLTQMQGLKIAADILEDCKNEEIRILNRIEELQSRLVLCRKDKDRYSNIVENFLRNVLK